MLSLNGRSGNCIGQKIFEKFYSLKGQVTGRKGSGLGLCFVREAAELHGGSAEVGERDGGGAEVIVRLKKAL